MEQSSKGKAKPQEFDQETYAKAKPHFTEAYAKFREAGRTLAEFVAFIREHFSEAAWPYLKQFVLDKQAELLENNKNGDIVTDKGGKENAIGENREEFLARTGRSLTGNSLPQLQRIAEDHMRRFSPKRYKLLKEENRINTTTLRMAKKAWNEALEMANTGMYSIPEAQNLTIRKYITLPPEE